MIQNVLDIMDALIERGYGIEPLIEKLRSNLNDPRSEMKPSAEVASDILSSISRENRALAQKHGTSEHNIVIPPRVQQALDAIRSQDVSETSTQEQASQEEIGEARGQEGGGGNHMRKITSRRAEQAHKL